MCDHSFTFFTDRLYRQGRAFSSESLVSRYRLGNALAAGREIEIIFNPTLRLTGGRDTHTLEPMVSYPIAGRI